MLFNETFSPKTLIPIADFCLLVFAVSQQHVFTLEFENEDEADYYDGGSNNEIVHLDPSTLYNPIPDFVTYTRYVILHFLAFLSLI